MSQTRLPSIRISAECPFVAEPMEIEEEAKGEVWEGFMDAEGEVYPNLPGATNILQLLGEDEEEQFEPESIAVSRPLGPSMGQQGGQVLGGAIKATPGGVGLSLKQKLTQDKEEATVLSPYPH